MKLTIDPVMSGLRERVSFAASAVSPQTSLAVLRLMRLESRKDCIEISSTNLDQTTIARIPKSKSLGMILLPPFVLRDAADRGRIFTLDGRGGEEVALASGDDELKVFTLTPDKFPPTPKIEGDNYLTVSADDFLTALRQASVFSSTDECRFSICSVLIELKDGVVRVVATNGRRIFVKEVGAVKIADCRLNVPASAIRLLDGMDGFETPAAHQMKISFDDSNARFDCGDYSLITKVIEQPYPNYRQVIPSKFKTCLIVNRDEFMRAVKFAALCAMETNQSKPGVTFDLISSKSLTVSSAETTVGKSKSSFVAKMTGEELRITFQPTYLLEAASALTCETLTLDFADEHDPVKITCDDGMVVIMPMRIRIYGKQNNKKRIRNVS